MPTRYAIYLRGPRAESPLKYIEGCFATLRAAENRAQVIADLSGETYEVTEQSPTTTDPYGDDLSIEVSPR